MPKLIKTDKLNYFVKDGSRVEKYDENDFSMCFNLELPDHSRLIVPGTKISINSGGYIRFMYDGVEYYIDDGYRNTLIYAGYLYMDNYNDPEHHIKDGEEGTKTRNFLKRYIYESSLLLNGSKNTTDILDGWDVDVQLHGNEIIFTVSDENTEYTIFFNTVNSIVNKNQQRKLNDLPFYPFDKSMDKYGSYYISVFKQKLTEKYILSQEYERKCKEFIDAIMEELNRDVGYDKYKTYRLPIKRKIIRWKGI